MASAMARVGCCRLDRCGGDNVPNCIQRQYKHPIELIPPTKSETGNSISVMMYKASPRASAKITTCTQLLAPTTLQSQDPGLDLPLALDFDSAARLKGKLALKLFVDRARHLNGVGDSSRFHPAREVHRVAP